MKRRICWNKTIQDFTAEDAEGTEKIRVKTIQEDNLSTTLRTYFGFTDFRPNQKEIILAILHQRDVFAIMPTGGGKSLCYQLPALVLPGLCLVISPLISLMKDQVDAANDTGISSAYFNSTLTAREKREVIIRLQKKDLKLLYISPERFTVPEFQDILTKIQVSLVAVDEAHCVSEWGHDFRPDYLSLSTLVDIFPDVPVAAFTATATQKVQEDIIQRLRLREPFKVRASFDRPNLSYRVLPKRKYKDQIVSFLSGRPNQSGIIYRTTRKEVDSLASYLKKQGYKALPYHAGLDEETRTRNQESFNKDKVNIMVATIAFGMGIDKSNIRFVVHADLPKNMEGYYQETGRAGRDGEPADCLLYFGRGDLFTIKYFIDRMADAEEQKRALDNLSKVLRFAQSNVCRRKQILAYFDEIYPKPNCGTCDVCCDQTETADATIDAQKALSAVARSGGGFGAVQVADILIGADTDKIRRFGHDKIKTFGAGKDRPKSYWRDIIDELAAQGYLEKTGAHMLGLQLSGTAGEILQGAAKFYTLVPPPTPAVSPSPRRGSPSGMEDDGLFSRLRELRRSIAEEKGVPPYIIFSDKTLRDMAQKQPTDDRGLLLVSGVGEYKLQHYGARFITAVKEFCLEK
jgi:ATP-dependent DNA helicase RecQ